MGLLLLSVCACGEPARAPETPPSAAPAPVRAPAPPERSPCAAGEAKTLTALAAQPGTLGSAFGRESGLVVVADGGALRVVPVDAEGRAGASRAAPFPHAEGLLQVASVGDAFLVVTEGVCVHTRCLAVGALTADGTLIAPALRIEGHAPIATMRRNVTEDALVLAFSTSSGAPPWVDTFSLSGGVITHARTALARIPRGEKPNEIVAVTGGARDFAVLHRIGSVEDPEGQMVLETQRGRDVVDALEDAAMIERFVRTNEGFAIVASFEFDRPLLLFVDPRGALRAAPTRLTQQTPLPTLFAPDSAALRDDGTHLVLLVRSLSGDEIARVPIDTRPEAHTLPASVTRTPDGFLVPYAARRGESVALLARTVRCSEHRR